MKAQGPIHRVCFYEEGPVWMYCAWGDTGYAVTDVLDAATEAQARAEIRSLYPSARVLLWPNARE